MCKYLLGESVERVQWERERMCIENKEKDQKMLEREKEQEREDNERGDIEREQLNTRCESDCEIPG
jgi:hypothetical protein